jgi:hypothetical protein
MARAGATLEPARYLGATDSLGTIAPVKLADLVLLDADPLVDIRPHDSHPRGGRRRPVLLPQGDRHEKRPGGRCRGACDAVSHGCLLVSERHTITRQFPWGA